MESESVAKDAKPERQIESTMTELDHLRIKDEGLSLPRYTPTNTSVADPHARTFTEVVPLTDEPAGTLGSEVMTAQGACLSSI